MDSASSACTATSSIRWWVWVSPLKRTQDQLGSSWTVARASTWHFPVVFLQGGVDYSISDHSFAFILSFALPIRRGGILGLGSLARVDWLPARGQTVNVGLQIPVLQPWVGKTRPKAQDITIPRAPHAQFERSDSIAQADTTEPAAAALAQMRREAVWYINLINVFYTGLGKSYDDAIQTQRDTIASFIKAAESPDALHPQGLESVERDGRLACADEGRLCGGGRYARPCLDRPRRAGIQFRQRHRNRSRRPTRPARLRTHSL